MDPQAALAQLREAIDEQEHERVSIVAHGLMDWLKGGGYCPTPDKHQLYAMLQYLDDWAQLNS